jgi:CHAD domain-containing protein
MMPYRLESDEGISAGITRCAAEQLDRAMVELREHAKTDPEAALHAARKAIKKERSLLRLARGSVDPNRRRSENRTLRDAARGLSQSRDAEAMIQTLQDLADRYAGQLPAREFQVAREQLECRRDRRRADLTAAAQRVQAINVLGGVRARLETWNLSDDDWDAIEDGLRRSYRDGRKAFRRARRSRSNADWHRWRKRAKDLWYQQRLLSPIAGPAVAGQAKDAHHLADLLGDDHDLAVLARALRTPNVDVAIDLDAILGLLDHRRRQLQTQALQIGARVYLEKPKAFVARVRTMWRSGREHAAAANAHHPDDLAHATRAAPLG